MRKELMPVAALLISVAVLNMGNGLQGTLIPLRADLEVFSTLAIAALGSAYFIGFGLGCFFGPHLVRRAGHIRAFLTMSAIASSAPLVHAMVLSPYVWCLLRVLLGFCFAVLYIVIESWLNERSTNENRGRVLSAYLIINLTVTTLGQLLITLGDPADYNLFIIASILVSIAAVPVGLTSAAQPAPVKTVRIRVFHLFRLSPVGFMGCLAVGFANGAFWALAPLFSARIGLSASHVAFFMSSAVIGGALGQWPVGRISDSMDRRKVIIASCLASCLAGIGLVLFSRELGTGLFALVGVYGCCAFPIYGVSAAHFNDHVKHDEFVEASSGLLLVYSAGAVIGPLIASQVINLSGARFLFGFTAVIHILFAFFVFWRMQRREAVPAEQRTHFTEALQAVETVSIVVEDQPARDADPRDDEESQSNA